MIYQIDEHSLIGRLVKAYAQQHQQTPEESAQTVLERAIFAQVQQLHTRFMAGEISQGHFAELLGISRLDLIHLLEDLDLQVTNL